jgi:cellulose synthase/poly-beta-1,6-N-acetylglucosamine synthase-like glycosyltransferase
MASGDVAQMVERSLSMREARGSIPRISKFFLWFLFFWFIFWFYKYVFFSFVSVFSHIFLMFFVCFCFLKVWFPSLSFGSCTHAVPPKKIRRQTMTTDEILEDIKDDKARRHRPRIATHVSTHRSQR